MADSVKDCGAQHPTNSSAVECRLVAGHDGDHQSSTGCAGSVMSWSSAPKWLGDLRQDMRSRLLGYWAADAHIDALIEAASSLAESRMRPLQNKVAELEHDLAALNSGRRYLPLSEVTDGHARAYRRAYEDTMRGGPGVTHDECVRAGLAAIQWPSAGYVDSTGDLEAKVQAVWDDMKDEAVDGNLRLAVAGGIAETHMLRAASTPAKSMGTALTKIAALQTLAREDAEKLRARDERVADQDRELAALSDGRQYLPLSEVTDGHVRAYRKAYLTEARKFAQEPAPVELDQCIRAGLAAIQWPEQVLSPEMREVPNNQVRDGDTLSGVWRSSAPNNDRVAYSLRQNSIGGWLTEVTVTRPVTPLPERPGAVIRCEITAIGSQSVIAEAHPCTHRTDDVFWNVMGESSSYKSSDITRLITVLDDGQDQ